METISFKLEIFEGPLDLLISLIGKKKIDVCDINISEILSQYLKYIEYMKEMDLEVASAFLVMASDLLYIKSKMLLPVHDGDDDAEDPRATLARSLNEYILHKESARILYEAAKRTGEIFIRNQQIPQEEEKEVYEKIHDPKELKDAFNEIFIRNQRKLPPPVTAFSGIVKKETYTVGDRVRLVFDSLSQKKKMLFSDFFNSLSSRAEIVVTFLALLALVNSRYVTVRGDARKKYTFELNDGADIGDEPELYNISD